MSVLPMNLTPYRFRGALATEAVKARYVRWYELQDLLAKEPEDPYLGEPPPELLTALKLDKSACLKRLDALSQTLKSMHFDYASLNMWPKVQLWWANWLSRHEGIQAEYLGTGAQGHGFRVSLGGLAYKLKVFRSYGLMSSVLRESSVGLHLAHLKTCNVARVHLANPQAGWLLMDFIGPEDRVSGREGKPLISHGFTVGDICPVTNHNILNGIIYDLGGIEKKYEDVVED